MKSKVYLKCKCGAVYKAGRVTCPNCKDKGDRISSQIAVRIEHALNNGCNHTVIASANHVSTSWVSQVLGGKVWATLDVWNNFGQAVGVKLEVIDDKR